MNEIYVKKHLEAIQLIISESLTKLSDNYDCFSFQFSDIVINPSGSYTPSVRSKHYMTKKDTMSFYINTKINNANNSFEIIAKNTNNSLTLRFENKYSNQLLFGKRGSLAANGKINMDVLNPVVLEVVDDFTKKITRELHKIEMNKKGIVKNKILLTKILEKSDGCLSGRAYEKVLELKVNNSDYDFRGVGDDENIKFSFSARDLSIDQIIAISKVLKG